MKDERTLLVKELNNLYNAGAYQECIKRASSALNLFDDQADSNNIYYAGLLNVLGAALAETGGWTAALLYFAKAEPIIARCNDARNLGALYFNKGNVYRYSNRCQDAFDAYSKAIDSFEAVHDIASQVQVFTNMVLFPPTRQLLHQEVWSKLERIAVDANDAKTKSLVALALGKRAWSQGKLAKAENQVRNAVDLARQSRDNSWLATALLELGLLFEEREQWDEAAECFSEAVNIAERLPDPRITFFLRYGLARCRSKQAEEEKALDLYKWCAAWVERARMNATKIDKVQFAFAYGHFYIPYCQTLLRLRHIKEAFELSESFQSRPLLDLMFQHQVADQTGRRIQISAGGQLSLCAPTYEEMASCIWQRRLNVIKYLNLGDTLAVWLLTSKGEMFFCEERFPQEEIQAIRASIPYAKWDPLGRGGTTAVDTDTWVLTRAGAIDPSCEQEFIRIASRLFSLLLPEPILTNLPEDGESLMIIPHHSLWEIPFTALRGPDGRYLADRFDIWLSPSLGVFMQQERAARARTSVESHQALVVGNPGELMVEVDLTKTRMPVDIKGFELGGGDPRFMWFPGFSDFLPVEARQLKVLASRPITLSFSRLVGADQELELVASMLGSKPVKGRRATANYFKRNCVAADVIHLATHGWWNALSGWDSFLLLAPDDPYGNRGEKLTALDVIDLRLRASVIVLSACETGLGSHTPDTTLNLPFGFLVAGASSMIVSLWKVSDAATTHLISLMFKELLAGKSVAQALASAQRELKKESGLAHPYYWASFVAIGDQTLEDPCGLITAICEGSCFSGGDITVAGGQEGQFSPVSNPRA